MMCLTTKVRICKRCGADYQPTSNRQKFCVECWPEIPRQQKAQWRLTHLELDNATDKAWRVRRSDLWKAYRKKRKAIRRALGFIPMNQPFDGCEAHHLDHDRVLYIPAELHKSISHNGRTGHNMEQMNTLALQWLAQDP